MFDLFGEIFATMKRNKLRTFLTGFAVAWGIFMLIVLVSAGRGLQNGVSSNFEGEAMNTMYLWPGWTSKPYGGMKADRAVRFDERTVEFVRRSFPEAEYLTGNMFRSPQSIAYGEEYGTWQIQSTTPDLPHIDYMVMARGRFLNDVDLRERRKVMVLSQRAEQTLFKGEPSLGKYVVADGIAFQIIGVYDKPGDQDFNPPVYIPLSTGKQLFDRGWGIRQIRFTVKGITTVEESEKLVERIRAKMGPYLKFDPADQSALHIYNGAEDAIRTQKIFSFINLFLWVIGIACIMAGIVGVGNIMIVTVKERTREIGIRKAIGASPWSIIKMIIVEAVFITSLAGYIGIVFGLAITELIAGALTGGGGGGMTMFKDPTVGLGVVFGVLALLVACGVVAGLIPALRATKIRPIEAMMAD